MILLKTSDIKKSASDILAAVDSNELSVVTETLELKTVGTEMFLNVTNKEYYAQVKINVGECDAFHATVNANLFLKLVSQITTEYIEFSTNDTSLIVKANGTYKLPLIYDNDKLLELPEIAINNPTLSFDMSGDILTSILNNNSKELTKGTISKPVQRMYYVDELGCITFTSGACVNNFTLPQPCKMLFNNRLVKLFKLFKNETVKFTLGYDAISDEIIQPKVKFESSRIVIISVLPSDNSLINSVPVSAIRGRANALYPYSVTFNRDGLLQTINRLMLFNSGYGSKESLKPYITFEFSADSVNIYDVNKDNCEKINYVNNDTGFAAETTYTGIFDSSDLKITLENASEQYITLNFGDGQAAVLSKGYVQTILPECRSI